MSHENPLRSMSYPQQDKAQQISPLDTAQVFLMQWYFFGKLIDHWGRFVTRRSIRANMKCNFGLQIFWG